MKQSKGWLVRSTVWRTGLFLLLTTLLLAMTTLPANAASLTHWKDRNLTKIKAYNEALVHAVTALNALGNQPKALRLSAAARKACNSFGSATGGLSHLTELPDQRSETEFREVVLYSTDMALACVAMFKSIDNLVAFASYAEETRNDEGSLAPYLRNLYQALSLSGAPHISTTTSPLATPGVMQCAPSSTSVVRPDTIFIGCASGDVSATQIIWQSWTASTAIGTGNLNVNSCVPDCAAGTEEHYSAEVDLSDPGDSGGHLVFQQVLISPTGQTNAPAESGTEPGEDWGAA
jgi:hypothetical protein